MSKRSVLVTFVMVLASALGAWAQASQNPSLPAGEMQAKAQTACLECHEARIILQQRLTKALWTKEVDKMIKWGALVSVNDREALVEYMSKNFPPDKASEPAVRVGRKKK